MTDLGLSPSDLTAERIKRLICPEYRGGYISIPQHQDCGATFVVPVFDESPQRVERLIESLRAQTAYRRIEVILVVNNKPDDNTPEWRAAFQRNQAVLGHPFIRNRQGARMGLVDRFPVYAIDNSSPGCWVLDSNVGKARQRGLLEATWRFAVRGVNGVVVHTDADCWLDDPTFVERTLWLMEHRPDLVGFAGSSSLELHAGEAETKGLAELLERYLRFRNYTYLYDRITQGVPLRFDPNKALGICIVHRAFEGVAVGGFQAINLAEDVYFGRELKAYAAQHGQEFAHGRQWNLGVVSAMRVSARTGNNTVSRYMAQVENPDSLVDDAFNPGTKVLLDHAYLERLIAAVQDTPDGKDLLEWLFVVSPQARLRVVGN